jgi:hypothetical protein
VGLALVVRSASVLWSRFPGHKNGLRLVPIPSRQVHYLHPFTEVGGR